MKKKLHNVLTNELDLKTQNRYKRYIEQKLPNLQQVGLTYNKSVHYEIN